MHPVPAVCRPVVAVPDPTFEQAIQNATQGTEETTLGPNYPHGYYFRHAADFDSWVAAQGGCNRFRWPVSVQTYQPPGLPGLDG